MKLSVKRNLAAMIIGMGVLLPLSSPVFSGEGAFSPDPVAFSVSMELGDVAKASEWLDKGMSPDFLGSRIGSGLMIGAWEGHLPLMKLFIARGADINLLNRNGESALTLAAWRGKQEAVKWLLERGARINAGERQWSALHYAVFAGHGEMADYLIAQGADINARTTNGSSVLMMAAYEGHEDIARKLIEKGANPSVKNDWGDGALEWSMRYNRLGIARMVTNAEEFNVAVSQPKEKWGEPSRSMRSSKELENLLAIRERLQARKASTDVIDKRIAAERVRLVRAELDTGAPPRATALEITASRKQPAQQSAKIVDDAGKPGMPVPPVTYTGKPRMPPKVPVRNY